MQRLEPDMHACVHCRKSFAVQSDRRPTNELLKVCIFVDDVSSLPAGVPIFEEREKQNCLALLGFASMLWCTEALPLYVTSMLVPLLAVVLRYEYNQACMSRVCTGQAARTHLF